jgi:hypothetical protein
MMKKHETQMQAITNVDDDQNDRSYVSYVSSEGRVTNNGGPVSSSGNI